MGAVTIFFTAWPRHGCSTLSHRYTGSSICTGRPSFSYSKERLGHMFMCYQLLWSGSVTPFTSYHMEIVPRCVESVTVGRHMKLEAARLASVWALTSQQGHGTGVCCCRHPDIASVKWRWRARRCVRWPGCGCSKRLFSSWRAPRAYQGQGQKSRMLRAERRWKLEPCH